MGPEETLECHEEQKRVQLGALGSAGKRSRGAELPDSVRAPLFEAVTQSRTLPKEACEASTPPAGSHGAPAPPFFRGPQPQVCAASSRPVLLPCTPRLSTGCDKGPCARRSESQGDTVPTRRPEALTSPAAPATHLPGTMLPVAWHGAPSYPPGHR